MISQYEIQYMKLLEDIYNNGYSDGVNERTWYSTKRIPCAVMQIDTEREFPILKSKKVFHKSAENEILWIWQAMSNDIRDLHNHIWDAWADTKYSIGKAYGYQMAQPVTINEGTWDKPNLRHYDTQTSFVLDYLKEFPNGRHAKTTLWNVADLEHMNLVPCVHSTDWNLDGGRLNVVVSQRSGDMPLGVPFNTTQYAMLQCMFAKHLGVKPGILLHVIADAHIYGNQMDGVKHQIDNYELLRAIFRHSKEVVMGSNILREYMDTYQVTGSAELLYDKCWKILNTDPSFSIQDDVSSFWEMDCNNSHVCNYCSFDKIDMGDVAV